VNASVSGSEVIIDGSNLVITVPGNDSSEARNLGQTARLYIRPVIHVIPAQGQQPPTAGPRAVRRRVRPPGAPGSPPGAPEAPPGLPPIAPAEPGAPVSPPSPAEQAPPPETPAPQPRPYPQEPPPTPAPPPPTPEAPPAPPGTPPPPTPEAQKDLASRIADEKQLRQSADQQIQILALQFQATRCNDEDVLPKRRPETSVGDLLAGPQRGLSAGQVDHQR